MINAAMSMTMGTVLTQTHESADLQVKLNAYVRE